MGEKKRKKTGFMKLCCKNIKEKLQVLFNAFEIHPFYDLPKGFPCYNIAFPNILLQMRRLMNKVYIFISKRITTTTTAAASKEAKIVYIYCVSYT